MELRASAHRQLSSFLTMNWRRKNRPGVHFLGRLAPRRDVFPWCGVLLPQQDQPPAAMGVRSKAGTLRAWAILAVAAPLLCGCAVGLVADMVSVGTFGKSILDHVLDAATGQDCNLFESVRRSDRRVCEPLGSEVARDDFKGLSGLGPRAPEPLIEVERNTQ